MNSCLYHPCGHSKPQCVGLDEIGVSNHKFDFPERVVGDVSARTFLETARRRWWILPIFPILSVTLLWAQNSELRTEPPTYILSETYEARDQTGILSSVGIDPASIKPFPDSGNLLQILNSKTVQDQIISEAGEEVSLRVSRSEPSFSLVDTLESDGKSSFVFRSSGSPTFSFLCVESTKSSCRTAIDLYVAKTAELRRESLRSGLGDLRSVLTGIRRSTDDSTLDTKIAAVQELERRLDTPLLKIATSEEFQGATISSVRRPTYQFGVLAGLFLALLILLQMAYSDRRVRSFTSLVRSFGGDVVLGQVKPRPDQVADRRTAVAIAQKLPARPEGRVHFFPIRQALIEDSPLLRVADLCGSDHRIGLPFSETSVADYLTQNANDVHILVVQQNQDLREDVAQVVSAMRHANQNFGVVLLG